jgi:hypothetical protein
MIGFRIIMLRRRLKNVKSWGKNQAQAACIAFMESAALYSTTALATLISYVAQSNMQSIFIDIVSNNTASI